MSFMKKQHLTLACVVVASAILVACGGGGGGSTAASSSGITLNGFAIKGPLQSATACADLNENGVCDTGETSVTTAADGSFTLSLTKSVPILVITDGTTTDSDGNTYTAGTVLKPCLSQIPLKLRFEALKQWLDALSFVSTDPMGQWSLEKFDALIAANKRDFDARFAKARVLLASDDWVGAMDELLEIIMRDKKWNDEAPRKTMVGMLELLTPAAPTAGVDHTGKSAGGIELMGKSAVQEDPQAVMVSGYRRKLSMMLN
jgi:hypothetical protein